MTPAELVASWRAATARRDAAAEQVRNLQARLGAADHAHSKALDAAEVAREQVREAATRAALDGSPAPDGRAQLREADDTVEMHALSVQALTRALEGTALPGFLMATHEAHTIGVQILSLHVAAAEREARDACEILAKSLAKRASLAALGDILAQTGSRGATRDPFHLYSGPQGLHRDMIATLRRHGFATRDDAFDAFKYAPASHSPAPVATLEGSPPSADADALERCPGLLPPRTADLGRARHPRNDDDERLADAYATVDATLASLGVDVDSLSGGDDVDDVDDDDTGEAEAAE